MYKEEALKLFPSILYKYRDWNNEYHKKIITNQELFFPSFESLNDPFDGKLPFMFDNSGIDKKTYKKENIKNTSWTIKILRKSPSWLKKDNIEDISRVIKNIKILFLSNINLLLTPKIEKIIIQKGAIFYH